VDPCLCNHVCYYEVHWEKRQRVSARSRDPRMAPNPNVATAQPSRADFDCVAKQAGMEVNVGDLVCEYRGSPKPTAETWDTPEVQQGTRGTYPENLQECPFPGTEPGFAFVHSLSAGTALLAVMFWILA